jgi:hypothetical protein
MAGNTPHEAVQNFLDPLRRSLSCVADAILLVGGGYYPSPKPHVLTLSDSPDPTPLGRDKRFTIMAVQHYHIIQQEGARGPWKVQTAAYYYTIGEAGDREREIFAYHWHPARPNPITFPHFHIYHGAEVGRDDIRKAHFPTGRVAFEDVLRLMITQFGVEPRRDDWDAIFSQAQSSFEEWRTWPSPGTSNPP